MRRAALILVFTAYSSLGHEIPNDVTIQAFVHPSGNRLEVLVRAPLSAMREAELPLTAAGNLDMDHAQTALAGAAETWLAGNLTIFEEDAELPRPTVQSIRVSLPSDQSFASFDQAQTHLAAPQGPTNLVWNQALLDVALEVPIHSAQARFSIRSTLARLGVRTVTVVRYQPPGGAERVFEWEGDAGGDRGDQGLVRLDPSWAQAAVRFVRSGFEHILTGMDHLLFLACLVIPLRSIRALVPVVTAFTVAHSITLAASAYGMAPDALWFPPLIEVLIALSIVYMAIENIAGAMQPEIAARRVHLRWAVAFGFGLVHGFGFSFALRQTLQFAGSHLLTSLAAFNFGVELGQFAVLLVLVPALTFLFKRWISERLGVIVASALIADTGWHWLRERGAVLMQYRWEWPAFDAPSVAGALRIVLWVLLAGAAAWAVFITWQALRKRSPAA